MQFYIETRYIIQTNNQEIKQHIDLNTTLNDLYALIYCAGKIITVNKKVKNNEGNTDKTHITKHNETLFRV